MFGHANHQLSSVVTITYLYYLFERILFVEQCLQQNSELRLQYVRIQRVFGVYSAIPSRFAHI